MVKSQVSANWTHVHISRSATKSSFLLLLLCFFVFAFLWFCVCIFLWLWSNFFRFGLCEMELGSEQMMRIISFECWYSVKLFKPSFLKLMLTQNPQFTVSFIFNLFYYLIFVFFFFFGINFTFDLFRIRAELINC